MKRVLYILGLLTDADIDWLVSVGKRESVGVAHPIILQGKDAQDIYIISSGRFSVSIETGRGVPFRIAELTAGDIVGEVSLLDSRPPTATVRAITEGQVVRIPRDRLISRLEASPEFAGRFFRALAVFLAQRLRATVSRLGYSDGAAPDELSDDDEVDPELMESMDLAGKRFRWILERLSRTA